MANPTAAVATLLTAIAMMSREASSARRIRKSSWYKSARYSANSVTAVSIEDFAHSDPSPFEYPSHCAEASAREIMTRSAATITNTRAGT